jgi:hypothetical protein
VIRATSTIILDFEKDTKRKKKKRKREQEGRKEYNEILYSPRD